MTTIAYTYQIISVGDASMEVVYTNPTYGSLNVGVRLPYEGETLEDVIAEASPAAWWLEQERPKVRPTVGVSGSGQSVLAVDPQELTPEQILELWRASAVISQLQAHQTLDDWGLYQQVVDLVTLIGNPVERAFYQAVEWQRNSPTIEALFSNIVMPSGDAPTPEDVDLFFTEAARYTI